MNYLPQLEKGMIFYSPELQNHLLNSHLSHQDYTIIALICILILMPVCGLMALTTFSILFFFLIICFMFPHNSNWVLTLEKIYFKSSLDLKGISFLLNIKTANIFPVHCIYCNGLRWFFTVPNL